MCYKLDHFGKHAVSQYLFKIRSGTKRAINNLDMSNFGSASLDISTFFHSFLLFLLKFIFFILYLVVNVQCLSIELALGLIHWNTW